MLNNFVKKKITIKIENNLATVWNECLVLVLGLSEIKTTRTGTESDRFWKVNYQHESMIELTVHLYMNPKNKKGSKILVQGGVQTAICSYVFNELPVIYAKVCEASSKASAIEDKSHYKVTKSLVKCDECNYKSSIVQMRFHLKNAHTKKSSKSIHLFDPSW